LTCPLSELQAAVLLPQLAKLDARNAQRLANVRLLTQRLQTTSGLRAFTNTSGDHQPGYYKLGFQYDRAAFGDLPRERFVAALRAEGIAFDEGFRALQVGRSPTRFRAGGELAEAERAHHNCLVLHHPVLLGGEAEIEEVVLAVQKVHVHAERLRG
jgi:dTDP-4-amino-4,6-dideoxygalactose transaminase